MANSILQFVSDVRALTSCVTPRWHPILGMDKPGAQMFLRAIQEMLLWPRLQLSRGANTSSKGSSLAEDWRRHLENILPSEQHRLEVYPREVEILERVWNHVARFLSQEPNLLVSTYLHFWNPLTAIRVTEPIHCGLVENPLDIDSRHSKKLRIAFELYTELDWRARRHAEPVFTANQLLQRLPDPRPYDIHWQSDCLGTQTWNSSSIHLGKNESQRFLDALPHIDLDSYLNLNGLAKSERLRKDAGLLFDHFLKFWNNHPHEIMESTQRTLSVLRVSEINGVTESQLNDRQGAFFLFGLAFIWQALRAKHLYTFPVSLGSGCSIATFTTSRVLSESEYLSSEHLASAVLYPIMLSSFFNAKGEVETSIWRDWRHELETPVNILRAAIKSAAEAIEQTGTAHISQAARSLNRANQAFYEVASRVKDGIITYRASGLPPIPQKIQICRKLAQVCEHVIANRLGIEDQWFAAANHDFEKLNLSDVRSEPVRKIIGAVKDARSDENKFTALQSLLRHFSALPNQPDVEIRTCVGPLETILINLYRNAIAHCNWNAMVTQDEQFRVRVAVNSEFCKIIISNPTEDTSFQDDPPVPCFYAEWWHERDASGRGGTWGGKEVIYALGRLLPEHECPAEQMEQCLVVAKYNPFTTELRLPFEAI